MVVVYLFSINNFLVVEFVVYVMHEIVCVIKKLKVTLGKTHIKKCFFF